MRLPLLTATLLCVTLLASATSRGHRYEISSNGKPLVKRPNGRRYSTILNMDGGATKGIISTAILIEIETSIKQYLVDHPNLLLPPLRHATMDDFDIHLVDYFDCMSGVAAGVWSTLYLASRGGQGAAAGILNDPKIVEEYGKLLVGGADALRVFYLEFSSVIYPIDTLDLSLGTPLDLFNPMAPGYSEPLYSLDGLDTSLRKFLGNATLDDIDTTLLSPAFDLKKGEVILFGRNFFLKPPSGPFCARMKARADPRPPNGPFTPDLDFQKGKNYFLVDVGVAAGAVASVQPAKPMTQVGSNTVEFLLIDGGFALQSSALTASHFVAAETRAYDFEHVAVMDVGSGKTIFDRSPFANAGLAEWSNNSQLVSLMLAGGASSWASLVDYAFYSNPAVRPFQYIKVQTEAPLFTVEGMLLENTLNPTVVKDQEEIGLRVAKEYRPAIDIYVRDFIFG